MSTSQPTSKAAVLPTPKRVPINTVVPYWRNPRMIPDDAVNAVIESIRRYGYQQPIVVDTSNVIIIGHTRYAALRRMDAGEVSVVVAESLSQEQVKQLRLIDNKTREFTSWNFEMLTGEMDDLDKELMRAFFPEVGSLTDDGAEVADVVPDTSAWDEVQTQVEFICPGCFHAWEMQVSVDAVKSGRLEVGDGAS